MNGRLDKAVSVCVELFSPLLCLYVIEQVIIIRSHLLICMGAILDTLRAARNKRECVLPNYLLLIYMFVVFFFCFTCRLSCAMLFRNLFGFFFFFGI